MIIYQIIYDKISPLNQKSFLQIRNRPASPDENGMIYEIEGWKILPQRLNVPNLYISSAAENLFFVGKNLWNLILL